MDIYRYIHYLYTHKVERNLKDTFDLPSHPSIHPIKLALRARGVNPALDPGGRCKGLVEASKGLWSENIKIFAQIGKKCSKKAWY